MDETFNHGSKLRDVAPQLDHVVIDQFNGNRSQFYDMLGGVHCGVECGEMTHAQCFCPEHWGQFQINAFCKGQCPFGSDQQVANVGRIAQEGINVISPHTSLYLREAGGDFILFFQGKCMHIRIQCLRCVRIFKPPCRAIHGHRGQGAHIVLHLAISD